MPRNPHIGNHIIQVGDYLKKAILMMSVIFCAFFGITDSCLAESENESEDVVLMYDSGIPTGLSGTSLLGYAAETVRFTPPYSPWTLTKIQIAGWNGYDNETIPNSEKLIYLEIRDDDLNLLYQFSDSHIPYFTHTELTLANFEIPPLVVTSDFYVCFYDRGAVGVAYNTTNIDDDRSFFYDRYTGELVPARAEVSGSDELAPLSWIIRAVGY